MPGVGNLGAVGLIAAAPASVGVASTASSAPAASAQRLAAPAATLKLSPDALSLLSRAGALSGSTGLASQLVGAAVLAAMLDGTESQDEKKKRSSPMATALVAAAAVEAYRQMANVPGMGVVAPVLGAGVSIVISGGA